MFRKFLPLTCASHHLPASQPATGRRRVANGSPSRVANGHPPHGRVHRAARPLRPPAQGPLLWLPCGVEARSGYPAASRHATTSPGAVSAPDHHGAEQVDETRGGRHHCSLPSRPESDRSAAVAATRNPGWLLGASKSLRAMARLSLRRAQKAVRSANSCATSSA